MRRLENPLPKIIEATEAASKILSLQADLFLLNQELKAQRQLRRAIWMAVSLLLFNLCLFFVIYWLSVSLHERGMSAPALALFSLIVLGGFTLVTIYIASRYNQSPRGDSNEIPETDQ